MIYYTNMYVFQCLDFCNEDRYLSENASEGLGKKKGKQGRGQNINTQQRNHLLIMLLMKDTAKLP